jgi:hypothetical protein
MAPGVTMLPHPTPGLKAVLECPSSGYRGFTREKRRAMITSQLPGQILKLLIC